MSWTFYLLATCFVLVAQLSVCSTGMVKLNPLPATPDYKAAGTEYDDGGMGPMFDFARSFINTALPGGFPADFINETITNSGSQDMLQLAQKLLNEFKGYVAAIVVGILFIVTVPLVGVCFCCCRLCGNCGGKRYQETSDGIHCRRRVFACILFVTTVFTLVGNICTYVSNDRMTTALEKVGDIVDDNLDDIDTFLNFTVEQAKVVGIKNLRITRDAIETKLDQDALSNEISGFAVNLLANGALDKMDAHIQSVVKAFDTVSTLTDEAKTAYTAMKTSCTICQLSGTLQHDPMSSGGLTSSQKLAFKAFRDNDAVKQVKDEIGNNVKTKLTSTNFGDLKNHVGDSFNEMDVKVRNFVDKIDSFKNEANDGIDLQSYKDKARSFTDSAQKYDKYRHIGGSVLGAVVTLIVSLQFFGLAFGSVGQGLRTAPSKRGCVSNAGGNFLIASVAFIFLFSWLLMLLTTLTFAVGSILERFMCQPLSPPDFELLKVADKQFDTKGIFGAPIATVLKDCRDGKAAYEAFHLDSKGFNISDLDNKLQEQLGKIDGQMENAVQGLRNSHLDTGNAVHNADASLQNLETVLTSINYGAVQTLNGELSRLPVGDPAVAHYTLTMQRLGEALHDLENMKNELPVWRDEFVSGVNTTSSQIGAKTDEITDKFKEAITKIVNDYVINTKDAVRNKVGQCTPLWNLYDSVVVVSVCKYIVDAFNGFWFSIGWCLFFFVPSIVFSVKLAKYYRTMKSDEEGQSKQGETNFAYESSTMHLSRSNKVGHSDLPDSQY